jgi:hypothetical protein
VLYALDNVGLLLATPEMKVRLENTVIAHSSPIEGAISIRPRESIPYNTGDNPPWTPSIQKVRPKNIVIAHSSPIEGAISTRQRWSAPCNTADEGKTGEHSYNTLFSH